MEPFRAVVQTYLSEYLALLARAVLSQFLKEEVALAGGGLLYKMHYITTEKKYLVFGHGAGKDYAHIAEVGDKAGHVHTSLHAGIRRK